MLWRLALPKGHSSPIIWKDRIYLTAFRGDALFTIAVDRATGKQLWERQAPETKTKIVDKRNNPASPSPALEENRVYVFFPDYGLIAYDAAGKELWKKPLGPFNNIYGLGASPVIYNDLLLLAVDQSRGSHLMAVDKRTGNERWKTPRPEATSGHATPIIWRAPNGRDQILLPGSFLLTAYDPANGAKLWWVRGLSWEIKSTPVIADGVIYVNGYGSPEGDPGRKINVPPARRSVANGGRQTRTDVSDAGRVPEMHRGGLVRRRGPRHERRLMQKTNGSTSARLSTPRTACWPFASADPAT